MARSPAGLSLRSFPTFEQEAFEGEPRADVLFEVTQRVVGELDQPCPTALLRTVACQHAAPQLDLPAGDGEERRILVVALTSPPSHLAYVELGRDLQGHIGWCSEHFLEPARPVPMQLDDSVVVRHSERPARPAASEARDQFRAVGGHAVLAQQALDLGRRDWLEE